MITAAGQLNSVRRDFARLWRAYAVSAAGTAVSSGALALVAVMALHATAFQVSLLAALSAVAGAALTLPLGSRVEFRRKRPVMVAADLVRCVALGSVPVAAALGVLSFVQLCVVDVVQAAGVIVFSAASTAHLKGLVTAEDRVRAAARFETTDWVSQSAGPPVGGLLIGTVGTTATLAVDAVSFLLSALGVRRLRTPEPPPPARPESPAGAGAAARRGSLTEGWRYLLGHRSLRPLFFNAMLFGGAVMMTSPLMTVLMLRELHFTPWQYGLALGLPCLGGIVGSRLTVPLTRRLGAERVLLLFGVLRTPWLLLLPLVPSGLTGLAVLVAIDTGLLCVAGVFNPSFVAYRMAATPDHVMARVVTAWSVSSKTVQPVFMLAGGLLAEWTGVRTALAVAGVLCLASAVLLPWGLRAATAPVPVPAKQESRP
ncbi:MFS transporter [Streptomyces sp. NPDC101234]|uniref:MFS transporter n=1 Tax=Streptomyces sp. NPDC101234 TaxID=3366138 RepID=UPI0037F3BA02